MIPGFVKSVSWLNRAGNVRVLVVGDVIIDK